MENGIQKASVDRLVVNLEVPTITANFDEMESQLAKFMEPYEDMDDAALAEMELSELKDVRAELNRVINDTEDGRKNLKKAYMAGFDEFEKAIKQLLSPARDAEQQLKRHIDAKVEQGRQMQRELLEEHYGEVAPFLTWLVPFDKLMEPWWLSKSNLSKAKEDLESKCIQIAKDKDSLERMKGALFSYEETERDFYTSLDLKGACTRDDERREKARQIAELEARQHGDEPAAPTLARLYEWELRMVASETQFRALTKALETLHIEGSYTKVREVPNGGDKDSL